MAPEFGTFCVSVILDTFSSVRIKFGVEDLKASVVCTVHGRETASYARGMEKVLFIPRKSQQRSWC